MPLQGSRLLEAWERGLEAGDRGRAAALLATAHPGTSPAQWEAEDAAELVLQLLRVRKLSFGASLRGQLPCDRCGAMLEFQLDLDDVIGRLEPTSGERVESWADGGRIFVMRAVTALDLAAVSHESDPAEVQRALLQRCVTAGGLPGSDPSVADALRDCEASALETFTRLNEGAEILIRTACADCGHEQESDLDIGRFLWTEIRSSASQLIRDVHELAAGYGWSEAAILAMSPVRRERYLELVRP
jgi:hypothetical protein